MSSDRAEHPDGREQGKVSHKLESFPAPEREQVTTFETDELTALCPFDFGGPDHYSLTVRYVPDRWALESKSLKQYLERWRDEETTAEQLADSIYADVSDCIEPSRLYVQLEQARRGGIEETVEVGDERL